MLPFVKPSLVKRVYPEEEIITYQDAVNAAVQHMQIDTDKRNILLAHQFVTGAARCDSEELSHLFLTDLIMWRLGISMARRRSGKRQCGIRGRRSNILFLKPITKKQQSLLM